MFNLLTKYLHQYQRLYIPFIGSFEVVEQPARLEFAERLIYPPTFTIHYKEEGSLPEAQLEYLQEEWETDAAIAESRLQQFGRQLKERLANGSFTWPGIGILHFRQNRINLEEMPLVHLTPVEAHKIIRENAQHTVLIGEQEVQSGDVAGYIQDSAPKRSVLVIIGWILLGLALLYLAYYFYKEGFRLESTGTRTKAVASLGYPIW